MAVTIYHLDETIMPSGYLAVDFFFALSGFVLVRTYEPRFSTGLSIKQFLRIRAIRLYPLHIVGIAFGAIFALQGIVRSTPNHMGSMEFFGSLLFNTLMLPSPFSSSNLFPINIPAWSLFFEFMANVMMVLLLSRMKTRSLLVIAVIGGMMILALTGHSMMQAIPSGENGSPLSGGSTWGTWYDGALRTAFSFIAGMVIARLPANAERPERFVALLYAVALSALLAMPAAGIYRPAFDLLVVVIASPILLLAASRIEPQAWIAPAAVFCGEASFALYALHSPLAHAFQFIARKVGVSSTVIAPAYLATALLTAWLVTRWIDVPVRHWVSKRWKQANRA